MQVAEFVARLNNEDRRALIERHAFGKNPSFKTNDLAKHLGDPKALGYAFQHLDRRQLGLLTWLSNQDGYSAPWELATATFADVLPSAEFTAMVRELRLWGLADTFNSGSTRTVATHDAVIKHLPARNNVMLRRYLSSFDSAQLFQFARALGLERVLESREGRLKAVFQALTQPDSCRAIVDQLPPAAKDLLASIRARGGRIDSESAFRSNGVIVGWDRNPFQPHYTLYYGGGRPKQTDALTLLGQRALLVGLASAQFSSHHLRFFVVPPEVERALDGKPLFDVESLRAPRLLSTEVTSAQHPRPTDLQRDMAHLVGFIASGRCEWRQDGGPYKRSLTAFAKLIGSSNDFYIDVVWWGATIAGLLVTGRNLSQPYLRGDLTVPSPYAWWRGLVDSWIAGGAETHLPIPHSGSLARTQLLHLLATLPTDTWVQRDSLAEWARFGAPFSFDQTIGPVSNDAIVSAFHLLEHFVVSTGKDASGAPAVMMTPTIQALIRAVPGKGDGVLPPWEGTWVIQADRSIVTPPNMHPDAIIDLWRVADLESNQGASVFRISAKSIAAALNLGLTPQDIRNMLVARSKGPLPATVDRLISDQTERYGKIRVGTAHTYVRADDAASLMELQRHKTLSKYDWTPMGDGLAFVVGVDAGTLLGEIRRAGFLPVEDKPTKQGRNGARTAPAASTTPNLRLLRRLVANAIDEGSVLTVRWMFKGRERTDSLEPYVADQRYFMGSDTRKSRDITIAFADVVEAVVVDEELD